MSAADDSPDLVLRYGDLPDQVVDVHLPPGPPEPRPVVVALHGGFWRERYDRSHIRALADALRRSGRVVVSPEYRRGRRAWPATRDDLHTVRRALPDLLAATAPGRAAAGPVTVVGHSAGGHLALWWALDAPGAQRPARVVALAPVADLARAYADDLGGGAVRDFLGGGPDDVPERYRDADVAPRLATTAPPFAVEVVHGDQDAQVPVEHSRGLRHVTLRELPDTDHFALVDPLSSAWPVLLDALG